MIGMGGLLQPPGISVPWGRIAFPVTGWTRGIDRFLEYPGLSEPDPPVLSYELGEAAPESEWVQVPSLFSLDL